MIPNNVINEIISKTDIILIINQHVSLVKKGNNYIGLCPFHSEKTPSFNVNPLKQLYYCFGCKNGGTIINFLMKYRNTTFYETINELGKNVGIDIKKFYNKVSEDSDHILEINQLALKYFTENLNRNLHAIKYLNSRGINEKLIQIFKIGYADQGLTNILLNSNIKHYFSKNSIIAKNSLIKKKEGKLYSYFYKRIIFPIYDEYSRLVAFGGRSLYNKEPKYLHSKENDIFQKRKILYGLNISKEHIRRLNYVFIVEGYIDMIMMYKYNINNVVAVLGSNLTYYHIKLIKKYTNNIKLLFDGDRAGFESVNKVINNFINEEINIRVCVMPEGKDPSDLINKNDRKGFIEYINSNSSDAVNFYIKYYFNLLNNNMIDKVEFLNKVYKILSKLKSKVKVEEYIVTLSKLLSNSKESLLHDLNIYINNRYEFRNKNQINKFNSILNSDIKESFNMGHTDDTLYKNEVQLIMTMLNFSNIIEKVAQEDLSNLFSSEENFKIASQIIIDYKSNSSNIQNILKIINNDKSKENFIGLLYDPKYSTLNPEKCIYQCIRNIKIEKLRSNLELTLKANNPSKHEDAQYTLNEISKYNKL